MDGDIKQNPGGKTMMLRSCKTKEGRLGLLRKHRGIMLTNEKARGIKGQSTGLTGKESARF